LLLLGSTKYHSKFAHPAEHQISFPNCSVVGSTKYHSQFAHPAEHQISFPICSSLWITKYHSQFASPWTSVKAAEGVWLNRLTKTYFTLLLPSIFFYFILPHIFPYP
jgi:hypothetical protein